MLCVAADNEQQAC